MTADPPSPHAIAPPATTVDTKGRHVLAVDVPCIQCGYNLRGLDRETVCPECGGTVERSLHGRWLRFADPRWLNRLRIGASLLWVSTLFLLSIKAFSIIAPWWWGPVSLYWPLYASNAHVGLFALALLVLTTRERAYSLTKEPPSLRKIVRCAAVLLPALVLLYWAARGTVSNVGPLVGIHSTRAAVWIVAQCGALVLLRRLASRIPSRSLAKATTPAIWAYASVGALLSLLNSYIIISFTSPGPESPPSLLFDAHSVMRLVLTATEVWIAVLLFLYYRRLKTELAKARRIAAPDFEPPHARADIAPMATTDKET